MRLPVITGNEGFQACCRRCFSAINSSSTGFSATTVILSLAQESTKPTIDNSTSNNGRYANDLTLIFGVSATVIALVTLVFTYLAWRVYKRPDCSSSSCKESLSRCIKDVAMLREVLGRRDKRPNSYGAGSRFEDGCIEMQDAATWKYYEGIDMPHSPT